MFTLRTFHLIFILVAIVLADMFGAWAIYYREGPLMLWTGILSLAAGLALCGYAYVFVRGMDQAGVA